LYGNRKRVEGMENYPSVGDCDQRVDDFHLRLRMHFDATINGICKQPGGELRANSFGTTQLVQMGGNVGTPLEEPLMLRTAAILIVAGFALPAIAEDKAAQLPRNSIDCNQFKKTGPKEWMEVGTAVFGLGSVNDINLTNQPVTPGYFKFGGFDVYPVLEQKCGAPAQEAPAQPAAAQPAAAKDAEPGKPSSTELSQQTVSPKAGPDHVPAAAAKDAEPGKPSLTELSQQTVSPKVGPDDVPAAAALPPAAPASVDPIPAPEGKIAENQQDKSCGERKSVYIADGPEAGAVEIAFQNKNVSSPDSEFLIRQLKGNEPGWVYKGKYRHGRFLFVLKPIRERGFMRATISFARQDSEALVSAFIKPNRNGTGEPILYLSGLQALFASKETIRRLKIEGKSPAGLLPETFYFDRCE
jgi:hypothetical protein